MGLKVPLIPVQLFPVTDRQIFRIESLVKITPQRGYVDRGASVLSDLILSDLIVLKFYGRSKKILFTSLFIGVRN
jgi:hypothetical protein